MEERIETGPLKPVCVGRFVLDVPAHVVVSYRRATVAGWEISTTIETDEEFEVRIQQKEDLFVGADRKLTQL